MCWRSSSKPSPDTNSPLDCFCPGSLPHAPVRQWLLSLPIPQRVLLAAQAELVTPVLQVVQRVITRHLLHSAQLEAVEGHGGAVTLIQCHGSAANFNIRLHGLLLDGVDRCGADGVPEFVEGGSPTDDEVHALLRTIITRLTKMLTRRGVLFEDMGQAYLAEPNVHAHPGPSPGTDSPPDCSCPGSALSDERVQINAAGQVELKLETPWRDGTTYLVPRRDANSPVDVCASRRARALRGRGQQGWIQSPRPRAARARRGKTEAA